MSGWWAAAPAAVQEQRTMASSGIAQHLARSLRLAEVPALQQGVRLRQAAPQLVATSIYPAEWDQPETRLLWLGLVLTVGVEVIALLVVALGELRRIAPDQMGLLIQAAVVAGE